MNNRICLSLIALALALPLGAQSFQESLFLNNYRQGYRYNAALQPDTDFVAVGEFSSLSANNVGASAFLYPRDGKLVTGFHSSVTSEEFLGALKPVNAKQRHIHYNLFSYGFAAGGAYHTIEVGARGSTQVAVPGDFFRLLKVGGQDTFDLSGTQLQGRLYAELAYGYSRKLADNLTVGARAKLLLGLYAADYHVRRYDLVMNTENATADVDITLDMTSRTGKMQTEDDVLNLFDWKASQKWKLPTGAGLALDLGVVWEPIEDLQIAASITDLGGLFWYYGNAGRCESSGEVTGLDNLKVEDMNLEGLVSQLTEIGREFIKSRALEAVNKRVAFDPVPLQVNGGIRYRMPFYRALSVGVTGNYAAYKGLPYWETRLGVGVNPLSWLDLSANIGTGTYGLTWGAAAQFRVLRFRVHAGLQNGFGGTIPYKTTPLQPNAKTVVIGLTYDI